MTEDSWKRVVRPDGSSSETPTQTSEPALVLGKDGKPCRSCSSSAAFSSWVTQTKKVTDGARPRQPSPGCPPDVEALGRSSWTLLHTMTANYPTHPTHNQQRNMSHFLHLFAQFYPCWVCAADFEKYIEVNGVRSASRDDLGRWMCEAHNAVNKKLGKPSFDCGKWEERWRTGWKDGSCD
ncbi:BgTH12-02650 [Blumeria graminis f. sp. triticale]|uniref:Sulfhydryl oxidase n=3 Tax=Blumeria graminis TaxID=34373 RepID=A0A9X9MIA9_BLUGR|nr:Flavin-linked sulfhydryl oxidase [Blumeria graminis f. sp. tritici 96224]CAD6502976.1 BgTH12-02650 [Blumeria graminis f. sp. triticale]VDB88877.1 Bgt-4415 [Blumeria graminis f. sp. tritici]